jgi:hypothetical protein
LSTDHHGLEHNILLGRVAIEFNALAGRGFGRAAFGEDRRFGKTCWRGWQPAELLNPIFKALDSLIENDGVYLYLVFVWLALLAIAWIFSGGLRKRMKENSVTVIPAIIFTMQPPMQPPPPIIGIEIDPARNGDDETMD